MQIHQPLQGRSQRTFKAILEAMEALLEHRTFEEITVAEIIAKAGSSTGSFYARFSGKDALLPALYARYHADLPDRLAQIRQSLSEGAQSLDEACRRIVEEFCAIFEGRRNLMRAITIYARTRSGEIRPLMGERAGLHRQAADLLRPYFQRIRHPDPEAAIHNGLFVAVAAIREAILFPEAPFASATGQTAERVKQTASDMLYSYPTLPETRK